MVYHDVAEIFDDVQAARERLYERVEKLSSAQAGFKKAPDAWSVAEILEHLNKSEQLVVKLFTETLPQAGVSADAKTATVKFAPFSMDSYLESTRGRKLKSPEPLAPAGDLPVKELLQRLRASRAQLLALRPRFEGHDLSGIIGPHPAYGPINPYQALAGVGLHEKRHLRQIEAITASLGYPA